MWSQILLCLLVGLAAASNSPAWKDNTEYIYKVEGRTLTGYHEVADQYSGILLRAQLVIVPQGEGLFGVIRNPQYASIHTQLPGWRAFIEEKQLSYKPLALTNKPFRAIIDNGLITDLIVDKEVTSWEANIIKSIVSQFQLNTKGVNLVDTYDNTVPSEGEDFAQYKTFEDSVSGIYETMYDVKELPQFMVQSKPWLAPKQHLTGEGKLYEVVKNINFTRSGERPVYHYGLKGIQHEPTTNQMGQFFIKSSVTRSILSGRFERYTIQNSYTEEEIIMSPTLSHKQKGSVVSMLNVTLEDVKTHESAEPLNVASSVALGGLTYSYNDKDGVIRTRENAMHAHLRSIRSANDIVSRPEESLQQFHKQPSLTEAPRLPFLPYSMGYMGKSIKDSDKINVVSRVIKLAQEIGQEMEQPDQIPRQDTLAKFTIVSSLLRIMDLKDLQQISQELYTQEQEGIKRNAWIVYRDATAETGTGPAFLTIKEWIESKKIQHHEAAEVFSVMTKNVRFPTEEYMRALYVFVTKPEIMEQNGLNDSALLTYTHLVRQVYVNEEESHKQFPVHIYGSFQTENGKRFVEDEIIPYLTAELKKSVISADSHKIQVYIRALGNIGHPKILLAYEPYLEGKVQVSKFQRLMMVAALDKLVKVSPQNARNVLFKIIQSNDIQEVRVAAVYQLMRTSPPSDMLSQLATLTNSELNHQVNSAIKSSIESAAELEGEEFAYLRSAARAAKPLLTRKEYGIQYSRNTLHSYVLEQVDLLYKQSVQSIADFGSYVPKSVKYALRTTAGGLQDQKAIAQAMVSSIEELVNVWDRQTEKFQRETEQATQGGKGQWSSNNVAKLLKMEVGEREQLEGNLLLEVGDIQKYLAFDNHSIEFIPELIRALEETVKGGKSYKYTKWINHGEAVLAFPTLMGFPFVYSSELPTVVDVQGHIQAQATPQINKDGKLVKPETITGKSELRLLVSGKLQTQLGFVTPFDHQQYSTGYDKLLQVYLPIRKQFNVDLVQHKFEVTLEPIKPQETTSVLNYNTWPYTTKFDILNLQPVSSGEHYQLINQPDQVRKFDRVWGKETTGMAFRVRASMEQPMDLYWLNQQLQSENPLSIFLTPSLDSRIHHTSINIQYAGDQSPNHKVVLRGSYLRKYQEKSQTQDENSSNYDQVSQMIRSHEQSQQPQQHESRIQDFLRIASAGIHNCNTTVVDWSVEFQGQKQFQYMLTGALSKSMVDHNARLLLLLHKQSDKPHFVAFAAKGYFPKTSGLDVVYAMKFNPTSNVKVQYAAGPSFESSSKVEATLKLTRTEERKQYLLNHPMYEVCRKEMEEGNHQLHACANRTQEAGLLDMCEANIKYNNIEPRYIHKLMSLLHYWGYYNLGEHNAAISNNKDDKMDLVARFSPNLRYLNVSIFQGRERTQYKDIRVPDWAKTIFVLHTVFPVEARLSGKTLRLETYRPFCVADNKKVSTFDNKTYPLTLAEPWTVLMQYVPRIGRYSENQHTLEEQLKHQIENYVVLVRNSQQRGFPQKDVKIVLNTPETEGLSVEIQIVPSSEVSQEHSGSNPSGKVLVDGKTITFDDKTSNDLYRGLVQIFATPNGEVIINIQKAFYIMYDGVRVKITTDNDKLKNSIRGLCGDFDGESYTDFTTPQNCVVEKPIDFIATYTIVQQGQHQEIVARQAFAAKAENCAPRYNHKSNIINAQDATSIKKHNNQLSNEVSRPCTKHQTRYVEDGDNICFTIRPLPLCTSACQPRGTFPKKIAVHCIPKSNVAELWKNQIDNGDSPNFSGKQVTKSIEMTVPKTCSK